MIILFTVITLAAAPVEPTPTAPPSTDSFRRSACEPHTTKVGAIMHAGFHRLGDLPDAHEEIAVNRTVSGCAAPMIVRYNVSR